MSLGLVTTDGLEQDACYGEHPYRVYMGAKNSIGHQW